MTVEVAGAASDVPVAAPGRGFGAALALEVYARKMARSRDTGERMDALLRGADWGGVSARNGANSDSVEVAFTPEETKVRDERGLCSGRGWDRTSDLPRVNGERVGTQGD